MYLYVFFNCLHFFCVFCVFCIFCIFLYFLILSGVQFRCVCSWFDPRSGPRAPGEDRGAVLPASQLDSPNGRGFLRPRPGSGTPRRAPTGRFPVALYWTDPHGPAAPPPTDHPSGPPRVPSPPGMQAAMPQTALSMQIESCLESRFDPRIPQPGELRTL